MSPGMKISESLEQREGEREGERGRDRETERETGREIQRDRLLSLALNGFSM